MQNREILSRGEKVILATMTAEDQPYFREWHSTNAELRMLIDDNSIPSMQDQMRWFERSKQADRKILSLFAQDSSELIGHGGFVDLNGNGSGQFRITIGNPQYWGKGYGTEATGLIIRFGFYVLGLEYIWLRVLQSNERAIRTYERVGFVRWIRAETNEEKGRNVCRMYIKKGDFR